MASGSESESDLEEEQAELSTKHIVRCVLHSPNGRLSIKVLGGGTWHLEATAALLSTLPPLNTPERDMFGRTLARRCDTRRVLVGDVSRNLARLGMVARFSSLDNDHDGASP